MGLTFHNHGCVPSLPRHSWQASKHLVHHIYVAAYDIHFSLSSIQTVSNDTTFSLRQLRLIYSSTYITQLLLVPVHSATLLKKGTTSLHRYGKFTDNLVLSGTTDNAAGSTLWSLPNASLPRAFPSSQGLDYLCTGMLLRAMEDG